MTSFESQEGGHLTTVTEIQQAIVSLPKSEIRAVDPLAAGIRLGRVGAGVRGRCAGRQAGFRWRLRRWRPSARGELKCLTQNCSASRCGNRPEGGYAGRAANKLRHLQLEDRQDWENLKSMHARRGATATSTTVTGSASRNRIHMVQAEVIQVEECQFLSWLPCRQDGAAGRYDHVELIAEHGETIRRPS